MEIDVKLLLFFCVVRIFLILELFIIIIHQQVLTFYCIDYSYLFSGKGMRGKDRLKTCDLNGCAETEEVM